jgi:hypothetical protein
MATADTSVFQAEKKPEKKTSRRSSFHHSVEQKRVDTIKQFCEANGINIFCPTDYDCGYNALFEAAGFTVQASDSQEGKEGTAILTLGLSQGEPVTTERLNFGKDLAKGEDNEQPCGVSVRVNGLNIFVAYMKSARKEPFEITGTNGVDDVYIGDFNTIAQKAFDSLKTHFCVPGDVNNPPTTKKWRSPFSTQWNKLDPDQSQKDFVLVPKEGPLAQEGHNIEVGVLGGSVEGMLPNAHHFSDHYVVSRKVGAHKLATLSMAIDQKKPLEFRSDALVDLYAELEKTVPLSVEGLAVGEKSAFIASTDRRQAHRPCLSGALDGAKEAVKFMRKWDEPGAQEEWESSWWQSTGAEKGDAALAPLISFDRACIEVTKSMGSKMVQNVVDAVDQWERSLT